MLSVIGLGQMNMRISFMTVLFSLIDDLLALPEDLDTIQIADENTFLFMQDNASCQKATEVLEFLAENHVPVMEWPAQSPDLNPLENLWTDVKARFHKRFMELFNNASKSLEARYRYDEMLQDGGTIKGWRWWM